MTESLKQKYARLRGVSDPDMALEVGMATTGSTMYITYNGVELALPYDTAVNDLAGELDTARATYGKKGG